MDVDRETSCAEAFCLFVFLAGLKLEVFLFAGFCLSSAGLKLCFSCVPFIFCFGVLAKSELHCAFLLSYCFVLPCVLRVYLAD